MKDTKNLLVQANMPAQFKADAYKLIDFLTTHLEESQEIEEQRTIDWKSPEEQLDFWQEDFESSEPTDMSGFLENMFSHSINFRSKGYMGHQISTTLPLTALTSAITGYMNNSTVVYEVGMAANAMEKVVTKHLIEKFGYDENSTGLVTSGGSLGNLTALLKARSFSQVDFKDFHKLSIMVSEESHYSVERAARIIGIPDENVIKVSADENFCIRTDLLESAYQKATSEGKIVFCIVGCACTTSVGAYDDLKAISDFADKYNLWFHVDGAHGGAVIFSDKYKHLLEGIEKSDSLVLDFHKMMLVPSLSTAVLFNSRKRTLNAFSPKAAYLWQDQEAEEWYNSAKHTFECTKPISILHTYAIMRFYGDEIYQQHVDLLYDLGQQFAAMISKHKNMELAVEPSSNIVCFRYLSDKDNHDDVNKKILEELLKDGQFYIVSTTIRGKFYLRVSLMNPITDIKVLDKLLDKVLKIAETK